MPDETDWLIDFNRTLLEQAEAACRRCRQVVAQAVASQVASHKTRGRAQARREVASLSLTRLVNRRGNQ